MLTKPILLAPLLLMQRQSLLRIEPLLAPCLYGFILVSTYLGVESNLAAGFRLRGMITVDGKVNQVWREARLHIQTHRPQSY